MSTIINAGRAALVPKGTYSDAIQYIHLDIVSFNGSSYICKADSIGNPPTDATHWQLLASGGGGGGGTQDVVLYKEYNGNKYEATWNGNAWIYDTTTPITPSEGVLYVNVDTSEMLCYMGGGYEEVNPLTIDSTPTASSPNPVASGGVYTALQGKQDVPIEILQNYNTLFSALGGSTQQNPVTLSGEALDQYNALVAAVLAKKAFTGFGLPVWADPEQYLTDGTIAFGTYVIGGKSTVGYVRIYRVEDGGDYKYWESSESETFALLDSPHFSGTPTAPTPAASDNSTKIATTAYVKSVLPSDIQPNDILITASQNGLTGDWSLDMSYEELSGMMNDDTQLDYVLEWTHPDTSDIMKARLAGFDITYNVGGVDYDAIKFSTSAGDYTYTFTLYNDGNDDVVVYEKVSNVTPVVEVAGATPTQTLAPNTFYKFTGSVTSLTLSLGTPISGITNMYYFSFTAGAANPTITWPQGCKLDGEPTLGAGDYFEATIQDGYVLYKIWKASTT